MKNMPSSSLTDLFQKIGKITIYDCVKELLKHSEYDANNYNNIINEYKEYIERRTCGRTPDAYFSGSWSILPKKKDILAPVSEEEKREFEFNLDNHPIPLRYDFILFKGEELETSRLVVETKDQGERYFNCANLVEQVYNFKEACKEVIVRIRENAQRDTPLIDLTASSAAEKLVFLSKLGVIEFLHKKYPSSGNALAGVLATITGEKVATIQSALNPMLTPTVSQKNNPLRTESTVKRVEAQLNVFGFITE